jgi:hypothetical protein
MKVDSLHYNNGGSPDTGRQDHHQSVASVRQESEGILEIVYHSIPADGLILSNKYHDRTFFGPLA